MPGLHFEEFEAGMVFDHPTRRTVTETDNVLFCAMTHNLAPLHLDAEYAKGTIYGQRLVNSLFILGLVTGVSVPETTQGTTLGNLGFDKVAFPKPVFHGDTIRVQTEVLDKRESKSRSDSGIVHFRHLGINQRQIIICESALAILMLNRSAAAASAS